MNKAKNSRIGYATRQRRELGSNSLLKENIREVASCLSFVLFVTLIFMSGHVFHSINIFLDKFIDWMNPSLSIMFFAKLLMFIAGWSGIGFLFGALAPKLKLLPLLIIFIIELILYILIIVYY